MCSVTGNLLIDNMTDGFDLYSANRPAPIRSFPVKSTKKYVKGGVFAEGRRAIACGSDHGKIYIFGIANTKPKQELLHGNKKQMIQTVAVRQLCRNLRSNRYLLRVDSCNPQQSLDCYRCF